MNRMLQNLLVQVDSSIDEVGEILRQHRDRTGQLQSQHDLLRKQHWGQKKELVVLREQTEHIAQVQEENERFQALRSELRQRLERILTQTKVLGEALRQ